MIYILSNSLLGQFASVDSCLGLTSAPLGPSGFVAGLCDVAVLGQSIKYSRSPLRVDEFIDSLGDHKIPGDDHAGVLPNCPTPFNWGVFRAIS